jgi:hypothetical protein
MHASTQRLDATYNSSIVSMLHIVTHANTITLLVTQKTGQHLSSSIIAISSDASSKLPATHTAAFHYPHSQLPLAVRHPHPQLPLAVHHPHSQLPLAVHHPHSQLPLAVQLPVD